MAIDPEGVKALFQAAIERGDAAARSLTAKSATTRCATDSTLSLPRTTNRRAPWIGALGTGDSSRG
jgi:hypothetical protein